MNTHRLATVCRFALIAFIGLGFASAAKAAGTVWVSDTFGQSGDKVGQFADRGQGKWDQVLKNRTRLHSYSQSAVTDQYVELTGSGGVVRLYGDRALRQRGGGWATLANGGFRNGNPLQAGVVAPPPVMPPPSTGPVDTRGIVWASSSLGQPGDKIGGFVSLGNGNWSQHLINGQKVHSYRQVNFTARYVELEGSGGKIRLYGDHAEIRRGFKWEPWTYGSFRSDVRIPIPETGSGTTTTVVTTPNPPAEPPTDTGNAGVLWVPASFGKSSERIGQFVGRGNGKWDQVMKNGRRAGSYRETAVTDDYIEISGGGEVIRLYAGVALLERGGPGRRTWTYGGFQNGNPLGASDSPWRY